MRCTGRVSSRIPKAAVKLPLEDTERVQHFRIYLEAMPSPIRDHAIERSDLMTKPLLLGEPTSRHVITSSMRSLPPWISLQVRQTRFMTRSASLSFLWLESMNSCSLGTPNAITS